ncbi:MAG: MerR family transcriptional regulator [Polyangiaceae bacterium]
MSDEVRHRISAVAKRTGVSEHVLRVWERRYGKFASHRSPSGYRLYSEDDIARIRAVKTLIDNGHSIGDVAKLSSQELSKLNLRSTGEVATTLVAGSAAGDIRRMMLESIEGFDMDRARRVCAMAAVTFSPFQLVSDVYAPLLDTIGSRWQSKSLSISQEHAASAVIREQLGELLRVSRPVDNVGVIVATTPEGELHELGVLLASIVAAYAGARIIYLGPNTPASEIATTVKFSGARAALLSMACATPKMVDKRLVEIRAALPRHVEVWVGGQAVQRTPPRGVTWLKTWDEIRTRVASR